MPVRLRRLANVQPGLPTPGEARRILGRDAGVAARMEARFGHACRPLGAGNRGARGAPCALPGCPQVVPYTMTVQLNKVSVKAPDGSIIIANGAGTLQGLWTEAQAEQDGACAVTGRTLVATLQLFQ